MDYSILIKDVTKKYSELTAIDNLTLNIEKGKIFGLIGPDGSGKTTLIRMIASLIKQDSGSIKVANLDNINDYKAIRKIIGYMPGKFSLYQDLTVEENLKLFATIFNTDIKTHYHLIEDIYAHLEPFKDRPAGKLSGGMKQKLALSCSLIHKPEILLLDEPTTGVDPVSRRDLWQMLIKLKNFGITIVVSTPYMDEASLCDEIALIQTGRALSVNIPQEIIDNFSNSIFSISGQSNYLLLNALKVFNPNYLVYPFGETLHLISPENKTTKEGLENHLNSQNFLEFRIEQIKPTIEDCFINLMSRNTGAGNDK
jgi:ABC-type multidrug transport system ATPase subunit